MRHHLRVYFAALDPHLWMPMARSLRASEGWCPPMMLIAVIGVVAFGGGFIQSSFIATACLYAWAACWATVVSISSTLSLTDSLRNLVRFRLRGYTRPRFWFEIARSSCILGAIIALFSFVIGLAGLPHAIFTGDLLLRAIVFCITAFFVASTLGYLLMLARAQRVSGRAMQCVGFFYPFCLASLAIASFLFLSRNQFDDPLSALATLVTICLLGALALTLMGRRKREPPTNTENAQ